eukprot:RCo007686
MSDTTREQGYESAIVISNAPSIQPSILCYPQTRDTQLPSSGTHPILFRGSGLPRGCRKAMLGSQQPAQYLQSVAASPPYFGSGLEGLLHGHRGSAAVGVRVPQQIFARREHKLGAVGEADLHEVGAEPEDHRMPDFPPPLHEGQRLTCASFVSHRGGSEGLRLRLGKGHGLYRHARPADHDFH